MTMLCLLMMTGLLSVQQPAADARAEAERLARTGSYAEALRRFEAIVAASPDDLEARVWIGRLQRLTGRPDRAVDVLRAVLGSDASRTDALIALGTALTDLDRPAEAISELSRAEQLAPDDPDVLAAQGSAHLALGHARLALAYYARAVLLRPADPAIRSAHDDARRRLGHRIGVSGFFESYSEPTPDAWAGTVELNARVSDPMRLFVKAQALDRFDERIARGGGGLEWRASHRWFLRGHALFGADSLALPGLDTGGEAEFVKQAFSVVAGLQYVAFESSAPDTSTARAWILSPGLTVRLSPDLTLLARYYRSLTEFSASGDWIVNDSGLLGLRLQLSPRVWVEGAWAGGTETFDALSIDRLGDFDANTLRAAMEIDVGSLTSIAGAYEYQWRQDDQRMMRVSAGLVQRF